MSCKNSTAPINLPTAVNQPCEKKCFFDYNYSNSSCAIINKSSYLDIACYDGKNTIDEYSPQFGIIFGEWIQEEQPEQEEQVGGSKKKIIRKKIKRSKKVSKGGRKTKSKKNKRRSKSRKNKRSKKN